MSEQLTKLHGALQGKRTYFAMAIGLLYLVGVWAGFWEFDEKVLAAVGFVGLGFLRAAFKSKAAAPVLAFLCVIMVTGCVALKPGADPLVVRVEQTQEVARTTFDLVLSVDNVNRSFWRTNAPGFHQFCEWLRTPIVYASPEFGLTNVPQVLMIQFQLDDVKRDYKGTRASSNDLWTAWYTVNSAVSQAQAWKNVVFSR